jgi:hypothetical protein
MLPLYLISAVLLFLVLAIIVEFSRARGAGRQRVPASRYPRRQTLLEERIRDAFEGPITQYGQIFTSYEIWRRESQTQLELSSADPWLRLNEFTRSIVVRHLWRALERLAAGSVVIVDTPPQTWSKEIDAKFDDQGIDPWPRVGTSAAPAPQFYRD